MNFLYTTSNETILHKDKITFNQLMRVLLQDLIEYHNGSAVDLTQIMRHGDKRKEVGGSVYERLKMRVI